jgi:predicted Zn-dependent protease with MMP-like domain
VPPREDDAPGAGVGTVPNTIDPVIDVDEDTFEGLVGDALDGIPDDLAQLMSNVVVMVEDGRPDSGLLGLYRGVPLTRRDAGYGLGLTMPDRITIYRLPICARCSTHAEVVEQVRITLVHEVAHHFGIDDHRLGELGYG